ncbi:MAG: 30S ribosomal protein S16 [bacterium]|nr:30S ribosomal protein S16 [bacterium]
MLAIKLQRVGKKGQASFRVIVQERRTKLQGRSVEDLGWANPRTDRYEVNNERASYWLTMGAQPTDTAWNLLVKAGVVKGAKRAVHGKSKHTENKQPTTDNKQEKSVEAAPTETPAV